MTWRKSYILCLLVIGLLLSQSAYGAVLLPEPKEGENWHQGDEVELNVLLDTEGKKVNTVAGTLHYPSVLLEFKRIATADSVIKHWVESPTAEGGQIDFAGIIPGGFAGRADPLRSPEQELPGKILTAVFRVNEVGQGKVTWSRTESYLHDGRGTELPTAGRELQVVTRSTREEGPLELSEPASALRFTELSWKREPGLWDGRPFIVFEAVDENYGIEEVRWRYAGGKWRQAESPLLLESDAPVRTIEIEAENTAGETVRQVIEPESDKKNGLLPVPSGVAALLVLAVLAAVWLVKMKFTSLAGVLSGTVNYFKR